MLERARTPPTGPAFRTLVRAWTYYRPVSDASSIPALEAAFQQAQTELNAYVAQVEAAHRELYPDPLGPDGQPRWNEEQALQRTAAWTEAENAELLRLREAKQTAFMALYRARNGGA